MIAEPFTLSFGLQVGLLLGHKIVSEEIAEGPHYTLPYGKTLLLSGKSTTDYKSFKVNGLSLMPVFSLGVVF